MGRTSQQRYIQTWRRFGRLCDAREGQLIRHVSTADTARDLDRLRAAAGEDSLRYLGVSYGTFLGATYANLFPNRVGARCSLNPSSCAENAEVAYFVQGVLPAPGTTCEEDSKPFAQ